MSAEKTDPVDLLVPRAADPLEDGRDEIVRRGRVDPASSGARRPGPATVVFVLLSLVYVVARLWNLSAVCLDADEIFSVNAARKTWGGLLAYAADDISHPPLAYMMLKLWMGMGESLLWIRLLPALVAFLSIPGFCLLCREIKVRPAERNLAFALFAVNGFLIYYAQHVRSFIFLQTLSIWSLWLFARYLNSERRGGQALWALFAVNVLATYVHYWGWVLVGTEFLVLLALQRRKGLVFFGSCTLLLVCFAPWAYAVIQTILVKGTATSQIAWIGKPAPSEFVWFYATLHGTLSFPRSVLVGLALFCLPVAVWMWALVRRNEERSARLPLFVALCTFALLPTIATYVASHVLSQSVWAPRQLMLVAAPYMLILGIGTWRLGPWALRGAAAAVLVTWATISGIHAIRSNNVKAPWDQLVAEVVRREAASATHGEVKVYANDGFFTRSVVYYLDEQGAEHFRYVLVEDLSEATDDHFWVIYRTLTGANAKKSLRARGYRIGEESSIRDTAQTYAVFPVWR